MSSVCIKSEDEDDEVCPIKEPRGLVYPWRSTDEEENDLERGLPPLGWTRGVYGGLDPRLGPVLGGGTLGTGGTGDPDNVLQVHRERERGRRTIMEEFELLIFPGHSESASGSARHPDQKTGGKN